jgi:NadR type nicotinamide-nucleotide adenylyltransferase
MKKIVTIGPESTGKSTLCEELSAHFGVPWVPEFAREYLQERGMSYRYEDLLTIARGQLASEDRISASAGGGLLIIDTDMYVMKVWSEFVFGKCHEWILQQIVRRRYDLYLLCRPDLPWVKDSLREYPDPGTRELLYRIYQDCLVNQDLPWVDIRGDYPRRLRLAVDGVRALQ